MLKKFFVLLILIFQSNYVHAEIIKKIEVSGNSRIDSKVIIEYSNLKLNRNYKSNDLNLAQKNIYKTGFFSDVTLSVSNGVLMISVKENPMISFFYIEGENRDGVIEKFEEFISLKENKFFDLAKAKQDLEIIKTFYRNTGYYAAEINLITSELSDNKINLVYRINRGSKTKINDIFFIGDKKFRSGKLRDIIKSTRHNFWKFLSLTNINPEIIKRDVDILKDFYLDEGYFDIQITSYKVELINDKYANIIFSIEAGKKYNFGLLNVLDQKNIFEKDIIDQLKKNLDKLKNKVYSQNEIQKFENKTNKIFADKKLDFAFIKINKSKEGNKVNINVILNEDVKKFVKNINVYGNEITEEKVIRNQLEFVEGDSFSSRKLKTSLNNLNSTGIFKDTKYKINQEENNLVSIDLSVEEQPTGSINAGAGFGSSGGLLTGGLTERNLFGTGITSNIEFSITEDKVTGFIDIINPDYKNSGNTLKNSVGVVDTDYSNVGYQSSKVVGQTSYRYEIFDNIFYQPGILLDYDKIDVVGTSSNLANRDGNFITNAFTQTISKDKRNSRRFPSGGYIYGLNQTVAHLGSDIPYLRNNLFSNSYAKFTDDYVGALKISLRHINGLDDSEDIKLSDRLFVGSRTLRGFESRSIGPKDGNNFVGGNYSVSASLQTTFPNPLPDSWNAKTIVFFDNANVWGIDYSDTIDESNFIRSSAGVALEWWSPLGPISLTFSNAFRKKATDKTENFNFQIGTVF